MLKTIEELESSMKFKKIKKDYYNAFYDKDLATRFTRRFKATFCMKEFHEIYVEAQVTDLIKGLIVREFIKQYKISDLSSLTITVTILGRPHNIIVGNLNGIIIN